MRKGLGIAPSTLHAPRSSGPPRARAARDRKTSGLAHGLVVAAVLVPDTSALAQRVPSFEFELETGPVWQTRNYVQIPNDQSATRFSLVDLLGNGPWPAARVYVTWNVSPRHALRVLLAPLSVTATGNPAGAISFAGESFAVGQEVEGTYRFNSWRLTYRYHVAQRPTLDLWVGFSAKIRDAEIRLRQGQTTGRDTDVGFVPLLNLAADWRVSERAHLLFDFDGLAGGPGRAFDTSVQVGYDLGERWRLSAGYRTLEGGADVDSVYAIAWLHYGVVSVVYRP